MMEVTVIEAGRRGRGYLRDLWRYRELFLFLAWRDLLVRYKQTVAGVGWSVLRPLLTMAVLTVVFNRISHMESGTVPYPLLVLTGILPWQFFAAALSESGASLVANGRLISKVYFPRLVVPAASIITGLVDFLISLGLLALMMAWYRQVPPIQVLLLPVFLLGAVAISLGAGLWVGALMVRYRDLRFVLPFVVQFGLYLSPVGFASGVVSPGHRVWYALNPMVGIIDGFRWCLLGGEHVLFGPALIVSAVAAVGLLVSGVIYFRAAEETFADII